MDKETSTGECCVVISSVDHHVEGDMKIESAATSFDLDMFAPKLPDPPPGAEADKTERYEGKAFHVDESGH